jgi:hypothetical protein
VWKTLKIFIAHPFVISQFDFTLPPLWSGNQPASHKGLFTVSYSPTPEFNEEVERNYTEKFELEFINFKVLHTQVPWQSFTSPGTNHK